MGFWIKQYSVIAPYKLWQVQVVPYLIGTEGDYRPEVSLEASKLSLSCNLFSRPGKLLMMMMSTGTDYLFCQSVFLKNQLIMN